MKKILKIAFIIIIFSLGLFLYKEYYVVNDIQKQVEQFVANYTNEDITINKNIKTAGIIELQSSESTIKSENKKEIETIYTSEGTGEYFYNQLNDYSKILYNALYSNKENMKTGTYEINLGSELSGLLIKEDGEKLLGEYYQSAIEAYSYDNPDVFYIDFSKLYLNIETTTRRKVKEFNVKINCSDEENYLVKDFQTKEQIDNAIYEIEKIKAYFVQNKKPSTYDNIKDVHDYIIESVDYDKTVSLPNIYNIYGAMVNKKSVCEGYAREFKYLMDALGIPCVLISGTGTNSEGKTENHAWNYVKLDENWYAIDCTWDDPILIGNGHISNSEKTKYFLKGQNEFNSTHIPIGKFTDNGKTFEYPNLSYDKY